MPVTAKGQHQKQALGCGLETPLRTLRRAFWTRTLCGPRHQRVQAAQALASHVQTCPVHATGSQKQRHLGTPGPDSILQNGPHIPQPVRKGVCLCCSGVKLHVTKPNYYFLEDARCLLSTPSFLPQVLLSQKKLNGPPPAPWSGAQSNPGPLTAPSCLWPRKPRVCASALEATLALFSFKCRNPEMAPHLELILSKPVATPNICQVHYFADKNYFGI